MGMVTFTSEKTRIIGIVFDIQRAAMHDGPGLRTTVFLKGCPLRCAWCHNPESQLDPVEVGKSGKVYGKSMTVSEVMDVVLADRTFYEKSDGGLTISGGEPTRQFAFCKAVLAAAREEGIHTCLDTSGQVPSNHLLELVPLVDLFHFDLKCSNPVDHQRWTGVDGELIHRNLDLLITCGARISLRCPIIPGVNDSEEHASQLLQWESHPGIEQVERLHYHTIGNSKFTDLGRCPPQF
jgi:pyruvate formate lyase activating enzyme